MRYLTVAAAICGILVFLSGCSREKQEPPVEPPPPSVQAASAERVEPDESAGDEGPQRGPAAPRTGRITSEQELKDALTEANPEFNGELAIGGNPQTGMAIEVHDPVVKDIGPLAELPLVHVDLSGTRVSDISPLEGKPLRLLYLEETGVEDIGVAEGMPLESVYLSNTDVEDIRALAGAPIKELNLMGTKVRDVSPLGEMRYLKMLWLNNTPLSDIGPLATVPLVSLTLAGSQVSDLSPLKGHPTLQRLHIARTPVTDLSVLRWLNLTRLIFTPSRIKTGIEAARTMQSLGEIGTAFGEEGYGDERMPPSEFWQRYDAGGFR